MLYTGKMLNTVKMLNKRMISLLAAILLAFGLTACGNSKGAAVEESAAVESDMVVFATPLYYYGMTSQLKTVVDRFCAYNSSLNRKHLKSALLTVAWNADDWTFEALVAHYKTLVRYLNLDDKGMVLGYGCGSPAMTKRSGYPVDAYRLGRGL